MRKTHYTTEDLIQQSLMVLHKPFKPAVGRAPVSDEERLFTAVNEPTTGVGDPLNEKALLVRSPTWER